MTTTFTINAENTIAAFPTPDHAEASIGAGAQAFSSEKEFGKITAEWPINRFVEIWNGFAGTPGFDKLKEVKKFENRAKATARIWAAIQVLAPTAGEAATEPPPRPRWPASRPPRPSQPPRPPAPRSPPRRPQPPRRPRQQPNRRRRAPARRRKRSSACCAGKTAQRNAELQEAMGWQPHSVRGFISGGLRKTGVAVENIKRANGDTAYHIAE